MLRKALLLLSGNATSSFLLLLRNLIVARLIPVSDYGVAATFAIVMAGVEMASALGLQQQIIQAKNGNDPRFQAALQAFQVMRGVVAGAVLFLLAGPLATFFGIPEVTWAYQVLALIPAIKALEHFDIHRLNRQMRFGPMLLTQVIPAAVSLALIWPLAWALGDWQVMLYSLLIQSLLSLIMTHVLAERPYALVWDRAIMAGSLRFGWPLLVNSALMFLVFQGDKMIVGRVLGLEALAIFAMGMTLTLTPTLVLAKTAQNLFLPRLSRTGQSADSSEKFQLLSNVTLKAAILNGSLIVFLIYILGAEFIMLVLGEKYSDLIPLLTAFAILNGLRVFKAGPAVIAVSQGYTSNMMLSNLPRVISLPFAVLLLMDGGNIIHILWLGIFAEFIGYIVGIILVQKKVGVKLYPLISTGISTLAFLTLVSGVLDQALVEFFPIWFKLFLISLCFSVMVWTMRDLFRIVSASQKSD